MLTYSPPIEDYLFLLYNVFEFDQKQNLDTKDYPKDLVTAIFTEAGKMASELVLPTNPIGDTSGCRLLDGQVTVPSAFKDVFNKMREGKWTSLNCDPEFGGHGMPLTIATAIGEFFGSTNVSLQIYNVLSHGVYSAILTHGTDLQRKKYLPQLVSSKWAGTMNLTEPQCGTDLGLISTKATRQPDNTFRISGQKIYISAGDHDLSDNIIHLVLARIPDSPGGTKGISMFIVPKLLTDNEANFIKKNNVTVGKLEKKMGINGSATCVMNYENAIGYLLGPENKGLNCMFTMMNEARHATGMQGLSLATIAYQNAAQYAKDRIQGKVFSKEKVRSNVVADPIIVHPDVRRMLLEQKSFIEGARAFAIWTAILIDKAILKQDKAAEARVSLLTPIFKAFLSDKGFYSTVEAQQVFGGHGYIEDFGVSQFVRDARIAMLYEGTNGIQAIDLVGRKLSADGGQHLFDLIQEINSFIERNTPNGTLNNDFLKPMRSAMKDLQKAIDHFISIGIADPETVLSGATDFLHLFGNVILGYMWCSVARISIQDIENNGSSDFHKSKIYTGRFFMERSLPETKTRLARILSDKSTLMSLKADYF